MHAQIVVTTRQNISKCSIPSIFSTFILILTSRLFIKIAKSWLASLGISTFNNLHPFQKRWQALLYIHMHHRHLYNLCQYTSKSSHQWSCSPCSPCTFTYMYIAYTYTYPLPLNTLSCIYSYILFIHICILSTHVQSS